MKEQEGKCANCEFYSEELTPIGYCKTCWNAYEAGYEKANLYYEMGLL